MGVQTNNLPHVKEGDLITAERWNQLVDFVQRNRIMFGQNCGIEVQHTPKGTLVRRSLKQEPGYAAVTTTAITARVGSAPGSGSVQLLDFDGSSYANAAESPMAVYLFAGSSIASGKYCWVAPDAGGLWHIISVEC